MDLEIRVATEADLPDVLTPVLAAFGETRWTDEEWDDERIQFPDYRLLSARQGDRWVGNVGEFPFEVTLPGGSTVAACGVTMVGVLPTHRRRGITTALMARLLDDAAGRGDAVAILLASESSIYGRFGFGVATELHRTHIDTGASAFLAAPRDDGELRLVADVDEAIELAREVWERHRSWRPGTTTRRPWHWELMKRDREKRREGASALFWVVHVDGAGRPDGYAAYRIKEPDEGELAYFTVRCRDLVAVDADVEAVLFRFLCDLDLVRRVELQARPLDDPLRWRLRDPRQLQVDEHGDHLWARVLDAPAALSARRYGCTDRLVLEVHDAFRPASGGRFAVEGGPEGAHCGPTDEPADVQLGAPELGSLLLGTVPASVLAGAGRLSADASVLGRADVFFSATPRPFALTSF